MENTPADSEIGVMGFDFTSFDTAAPSRASPSSKSASRVTSLPKPSSRGRDGHSSYKQRQTANAFNQVGAVGQFSLGPALQTTTITTTTTTTTSLPPLLLEPRLPLASRDPKQYPLAGTDTPEFLKSIHFEAGGVPAVYNETADGGRLTHEWNERHAAIQVSNGKVQTKSSSRPHGILPRQIKHDTRTRTATDASRSAASASSSYLQKSSAEPILAQAAELAEQHRRGIKRFRPGHGATSSRRAKNHVLDDSDGSTRATSDGEVGKSGPSRISSKRPKPRISSKPSLAPFGNETDVDGSMFWPSTHQDSDFSSSRTVSLDSNVKSPSSTLYEPASPPAQLTGLNHAATVLDGPGVSATPPIADTDLEPMDDFETADVEPPRPRPAPLDTTTINDVSLPSPGLSPVTAAANSGHNSASPVVLDMDDDDLSTFDLAADGVDENTLHNRRTANLSLERLEMPSGFHGPGNGQLPTPNLMDAPKILESFDAMPDKMKTYLMFQMLRMCPRSTLQFVVDIVEPALKIDFLGRLPTELGINVIRFLDAQSLCRAAQVSKRWRTLVNSDERGWKDLFAKDGYELPSGELERAVREGWGWQYPHDGTSFERDLSAETDTYDGVNESGSSNSTTLSKGKRKSVSSRSTRSSKKRKMSPTTAKPQTRVQLAQAAAKSPWMQKMTEASGPGSQAQAAMLAVPNPNVGIPSLRSMHLYKTLYQRHHIIRRNWMHTDTQPQHLTFKAHGRHVVTCLQFDTDKILTGSDDTHINVYETKTGKLRAKLQGHEGGVWALQYDGNILVSGSTDRSVRVWDIEKKRCLQVFQGHTSTVRCLQILKPTKVGEFADGTPVMVPKKPLIITGSRDSTLRIWKLPGIDDEPFASVSGDDRENPYFVRVLQGHHHSVRTIAAHADTLVSGSYDCIVRVWKISTGEVLHRLTGHNQKVYSVVLDHQRNRCISGSMDNLVKVWSLETGQCLFNLEGHSSLVGLLDLSHDRLVSAAADSTLRIWDPETGQCKSTLSAHTGAITCFQHDGQKVISGSDRTLKMWNIKTGECIKNLLTDLSGVWQVKFNDRRCVAAVQRENTTYIEVLDFGAARDGVPADQRGRRIFVNKYGQEIDGPDIEEIDDGRPASTG